MKRPQASQTRTMGEPDTHRARTVGEPDARTTDEPASIARGPDTHRAHTEDEPDMHRVRTRWASRAHLT